MKGTGLVSRIFESGNAWLYWKAHFDATHLSDIIGINVCKLILYNSYCANWCIGASHDRYLFCNPVEDYVLCTNSAYVSMGTGPTHR